MRRPNPDPAADERLERLLDEELRAVAQPAPVDVQAKVLAALEDLVEVPGAQREAPSDGTHAPKGPAREGSGFSRILRPTAWPRWALSAAAAAVLIAAVFVALRVSVPRVPEQVAANRPPLGSVPLAADLAVSAAEARPTRIDAGVFRRARMPVNTRPDAEPVMSEPSPSNEPHLPGAPAGELGDPLQPMPSPPPISFAPIALAPTVSDLARTVTDFPADNPVPAVPSGTTGQSGGARR